MKLSSASLVAPEIQSSTEDLVSPFDCCYKLLQFFVVLEGMYLVCYFRKR